MSAAYESKVFETGTYYAAWADMNTSGTYDEFSITGGNVSPNLAITDEYQISRSPSVNVWAVRWNGSVIYTPNVGFWSGSCPEMGSEVYASSGHADNVNMYSSAVNGAGQFVQWGTQHAHITHPGLNAYSFQNSAWSWNTER